MLSIKQNLYETMHHGNPDRFVNQFEYLELGFAPILFHIGGPQKGQTGVKNAWGETLNWFEDQPGQFPDHSPEKIVIQDIEHWQDYVHAPNIECAEEEWQPLIAQYEGIDHDQQYFGTFQAPGIFEECHHLGEIKNTLVNLYEYPDEMHDLIKYITEFELKEAEMVMDHVPIDALFHHDDWGTQISTFMSPDMFAEFFLEPYKEVYGYYKSRSVQLVVHHSDSFAATLVPYMIEMGIDIWQGCMEENNVPELIKKYGDKITFMGDINSAKVDYAGWDKETVAAEVKRACDECGKYSFIPNTTMGEPHSLNQGVYEAVSDAISAYSKEYFAK